MCRVCCNYNQRIEQCTLAIDTFGGDDNPVTTICKRYVFLNSPNCFALLRPSNMFDGGIVKMYANQLENYVQYKFITVLTVESLAICLSGLSTLLDTKRRTHRFLFSDTLSIFSNVQY